MIDKSMAGLDGKTREYSDVAPTLTSREYKEPRLINVNAMSDRGGVYRE